MIRRNLKYVVAAGFALTLILSGVGAACTKEVVKEVEVIKEVPVEVIREIRVDVPVEVPVEVPVPMTLAALAQAIRDGDIDVGAQYGLSFDQRYHEIHATQVGLQCAACHVADPDAAQEVFLAQNTSPLAPGAVDKRACLGCHREGPASDIYGS